jgi:hypothetical protein
MDRLQKLNLLLLLFTVLLTNCKENDAQPPVKKELLKDNYISGTDNSWKFLSSSHYNIDENTKIYSGEVSKVSFTSSTNSLKISSKQIYEGTDIIAGSWFQELLMPSIPKGANLLLKAKIKVENVEGEGVALSYHALTNDRKTENGYDSTEGLFDITGTIDFKEYTLRIENYTEKFGPNEVIRISLTLLPGTKGTVYFDDISFVIE